jgi:hypothetical protein
MCSAVRTKTLFVICCPFSASLNSYFALVRQRQLLVTLRSACISTAENLDDSLPAAPASPSPLEMRALRQVL